MKCQICKQATNYDESFGYDEFIVCPSCFNKLCQNIKSIDDIMTIIFRCGKIRREKIEQKN